MVPAVAPSAPEPRRDVDDGETRRVEAEGERRGGEVPVGDRRLDLEVDHVAGLHPEVLVADQGLGGRLREAGLVGPDRVGGDSGVLGGPGAGSDAEGAGTYW